MAEPRGTDDEHAEALRVITDAKEVMARTDHLAGTKPPKVTAGRAPWAHLWRRQLADAASIDELPWAMGAEDGPLADVDERTRNEFWEALRAMVARTQTALDTGTPVAARGPALEFLTVKELRARVAAAGPRRFLLRGFWPAGDYGVHAGDMKAQKTWTTVDAVVSAASGTDWLGLIPVDLSGPVLMFAGEGGDADLLRRIDAVAAARGLVADDLPITICTRAPHLSDAAHLGLMADQLDRIRPVLSTVDPAYLALRGAKGSDLYAMGAVLETPQHLCQAAGSALWMTTHQNRKDGRGPSRITGAGPAEWGRVLIGATVISRHLDMKTTETTVITELDVIGGSIPGGRLRVVRRVAADDPDDLGSPLHYHVEASESDEHDGQADEADMPPARAKLLAAIRAAEGTTRTTAQLVDWIAKEYGHGLRRETVSRELNALAKTGLADRIDHGVGHSAEWFSTEQESNP